LKTAGDQITANFTGVGKALSLTLGCELGHSFGQSAHALPVAVVTIKPKASQTADVL
jgi:hypothetical protein